MRFKMKNNKKKEEQNLYIYLYENDRESMTLICSDTIK